MVAVNSTLGVIQGGSITLEVYISGYPTVRSTNVHWYHLNLTRQEITSGATFQNSRRRMILRNIQASAARTYECEATIPLFGSQKLRGSARIQLQVYGKLVSGCGYPIMYCTALRARVVSHLTHKILKLKCSLLHPEEECCFRKFFHITN